MTDQTEPPDVRNQTPHCRLLLWNPDANFQMPHTLSFSDAKSSYHKLRSRTIPPAARSRGAGICLLPRLDQTNSCSGPHLRHVTCQWRLQPSCGPVDRPVFVTRVSVTRLASWLTRHERADSTRVVGGGQTSGVTGRQGSTCGVSDGAERATCEACDL